MDDEYYQTKKAAAQRIYNAEPLIQSPFFKEGVTLGPEGFRHLQYSAHGERGKREQIERFTLLPLALHILKTATTLQGYRERWMIPAHAAGARRGGEPKELVQWWGFVALFVKQDIKMRVVVRKVADGNLHFWSLMLYPEWKSRGRFTG